MRIIYTISLLVLLITTGISQSTKVQDTAFDNKISSLLSFTVPVISVTDLKELIETESQVLILDAREKEEYETSHIPGAIHIGYDHFDQSKLDSFQKDARVVVYCSIGYRSEKVGEKLQNAGFDRVSNLYGSIFEWVNQGNEVEDKNAIATKKVHTYNWQWSKWLVNPDFEKVY